MPDSPAIAPPSIAPPTLDPSWERPAGRRRVALNFVALAGTSVLGLVTTILVSVWVRRAMGPEAVGQIGWATAAVALVAGLVTPGLLPVGQRALARTPERTAEIAAVILTLQTLLALVVYLGILLVAWAAPRGPIVSLLLAVQGLTLFLTAWNTGWVLQGHERMAAPGLAALALGVLQLPALVLLVHGPQDVAAYAVIVVASTAGGVAFNLWYLSRCRILAPLRLRPALRGWRGLLREASPLALSQLGLLGIANAGILVLGFTHGDDAVGQFSSAYRLMLVASLVTAALWNAYFPVFARADADPPLAKRLSREYLSVLAWMGLPFAALGWSFGGEVVELLYGPAFAEAGRYFEVLCVAAGLTFLNYGITSVLVPWGRGDLQLRLIAASAGLNVAMVAIGVPLFGPWFAVAAIVAGEALVLLLGIAVRRRADIFWHPVLPVIVAPLACSIAVAAILAAVPRAFHGLWGLQLAAAAATLAAALLIFEWRALRRLRDMLRAR